MSRCFPYPPPGYEKKPRNDDVDLLTKGKAKKKKHKREKKDKEKRDGKERRHDDKSKDKLKEKKDRKDKHKEKRRHKDRDKEKISDRPNAKRAQDQNANKVCDSSKEVKDSKFTEELSKRYKDDGVTNRIFENGNSSAHTSEGSGPQSSMEKERQNRMEVVNNTSKQSRNDKLCKYSDQTTHGNKKAKEMSPLAINISNRDNRKYDETGISMEKELDKRNAEHQALGSYEMDTSNGHKDQRRNNILGQLVQKGAEKEANGKQNVAQSIVKLQTNNERLHQTLVDAAKYTEESEKPKVREVDGVTPNHHRHKDREDKKQKDKERHKKQMRKEEKDNSKHKRKEHDKSNDIQEKQRLGTLGAMKDNENYADIEENLKKRKDQQMNGIFHEIDLRPNKFPRSIENGRKLGSCNLPTPSPSKLRGMNSDITENRALDKSKHTNLPIASPSKLGGMHSDIDKNCTLDKSKYANFPIPFSSKLGGMKDIGENRAIDKSKHAINGALLVGSMCSIPANMSQNNEASVKAPHPDSKYLQTVYNVPKMEDWLEFDNQDWLFQRDVSRLKPMTDAKIDEMIPQVWSEGRKIESADVFALPYVIPY